MVKVTILVARASTLTARDFRTGAAAFMEQAVPLLPEGLVASMALRFCRSYFGRGSALFDAIVDIFFYTADDADEFFYLASRNGALTALATRLVSLEDSSVLVCEEYEPFLRQPPSGPSELVVTNLLVRRDGLPFPDFKRHHLDVHVPLFLELPQASTLVRSYQVSHVLDDVAICLPSGEYDGLAEIGFDNALAMASMFTSRAYMDGAGKDEAEFLDAGKTVALMSMRPVAVEAGH
jgi:hypothetical protein